MFDWLGNLVDGIVSGITGGFKDAIDYVIGTLRSTILQWFYDLVFDGIADFFTNMGEMGSELFDLSWVQATIKLFTLFGWGLFIAGVVVAVFDLAIEYQNGRASIKTTAINVLKGFFACSLIGVLPVELYRFCISLQNSLSHELSELYIGIEYSVANMGLHTLRTYFTINTGTPSIGLFLPLALIAFAYCVVKIFFQNIKRGGILLVQMSVGSLYMFSVPRGYTDGFVQWMKQVIAICLTAFMQTTLLFLGLLTFKDSMLLGLGVMLAASEVPRIAQQFGLDSSAKVNFTSIMYTASSAVNLTKTIVRAGK